MPIMPKKTGNSRAKLSTRELSDLDVEISFMDGLVRRDPQYVEAMVILADDYTRRGLFEEGLRVDESLCALRPDDCMVHYNLACSYSLTSQCERAAEALDLAIKLGYHDFAFMASDPDLNMLREHAEYKKIQARARRYKAKAS